MEVQEVLGEREFQVGRFYYLRESYPAAEARLRSLVDKYPLYSQADEALFLLGQSYEGAVVRIRASNMRNEAAKARLIQDYENKAADAYSRILTRYPMMDRADDAKARLLAMKRPVPRATKAMLAQNKAEVESRKETGMVSHLMGNFKKHPDVAQATKVGEPTLVDPTPMSATEVIQQASKAMQAPSPAADKNAVAIETVNNGTPAADQPAPRSDTPTETAAPPATDNQAAPAGNQSTAGELTPNVPADPNELKPNAQDDTSNLPPPQQVNEMGSGPTDAKTAESSSSTANEDEGPGGVSSSKKKKKKGLKKLIPF
jgi:outer membrane protein assembly factor BamD